jgi:hypothetical protein
VQTNARLVGSSVPACNVGAGNTNDIVMGSGNVNLYVGMSTFDGGTGA